MYHHIMMILILTIIFIEFFSDLLCSSNRELTQLQSILQNQIERHGQNVFKDGTVIIPAQVSISNAYTSIQLASQFGGEDVVVAQYLNTTTPATITGATSGVKAKVIGVEAGTSTTQPSSFYSIYSGRNR